MNYESPALGLYVLNGVLPEPDFPVINPVLLVKDGYLYVAVKNGDNVWRYDAESDTLITQDCDGIDAGGATEEVVRAYNINLQHAGEEPVPSMTKSSILGRIG